MIRSLSELRFLGVFDDHDVVEPMASEYGIEPHDLAWRLSHFDLREIDGEWDELGLTEADKTVIAMMEAYRSNDPPPPIIVIRHPPLMFTDRGFVTTTAIDGAHRVTAASRLGLDSILAWVAEAVR
jgi:hypothetical protein